MSPSTIISRADALAAVSGAIADRTAFVIVGLGPDDYCALGGRLRELPSFTAYLEGVQGVLRTGDWWAPCVATEFGIPAGVVVLVSKQSVTAAELSKALDGQVAADGSQDIVILSTGMTCWPALFIDALELTDPRAAASIRLADIAATN
jgi:hypothetical protein